MTDEIREFLVYTAVGLPVSFVGLNLFTYYMASAYHHHRLIEERGRNLMENNMTSQEAARKDLAAIESSGWFTRNIMRVGERIAYKRFLKSNP